MTEPNIPLLRKAVEWVEWQDGLPDIDREWAQEFYSTTPTLRAVSLVTAVIGRFNAYFNPETVRVYAEKVAPHCGTTFCVAGYIAVLVDKRYATNDVINGVHSSDVASRALGISHSQAALLFNGGNSAAKVREVCEQIAGEPL